MTDTTGTKKVNLSKSYLHGTVTYGPGKDVEVPADFPDLEDKGDIPEKIDLSRGRSFASAPSTGGVDTGEGRLPPPPKVPGTEADQSVGERDVSAKPFSSRG